jgi:hypothetical protein
MSSEVYFSVDIESDGPIPGENSMLSLGAAAFYNGKMVSTFSVNLKELDGAQGDPDTMKWWSEQKEAWEACRKDTINPNTAMHNFVLWVENLCQEKRAKPVFVAFPSGYDFTYVYWYMMKFVRKSPFSFSAIDIKTMAWTLLGGEFRNATKRNFPRKWFGPKRHTHIALDDAIEQGEMFCKIMEHARTV